MRRPEQEQSPSMGTLAFRRSLWANGAKYPKVDVGEDVGFLNSAIQECACSTILPGDEGIYVRHVGGGNTWNWRNESVGKGTTGRSMTRIPRPPFLSNATDTRCMRAEGALVARVETKLRQKYRGGRRNLVMIPWHDFKATFSLLPARCLESTSTARDSCPVEDKQRELRRLLVDSVGPPPMALTPPPPPPQFDVDAIRAAVVSSLYATGVKITAGQLTLEDIGGTSVKVTIVQLETGPTAEEVTTAAQEPLFLEDMYMSGIACGFSQSPVTTVIPLPPVPPPSPSPPPPLSSPPSPPPPCESKSLSGDDFTLVSGCPSTTKMLRLGNCRSSTWMHESDAIISAVDMSWAADESSARFQDDSIVVLVDGVQAGALMRNDVAGSQRIPVSAASPRLTVTATSSSAKGKLHMRLRSLSLCGLAEPHHR